MGINWEDRAWDDYLYWQSQDKKTLKRINALIKDANRSPYEGIGKPVALKAYDKKVMRIRIPDLHDLLSICFVNLFC